MIYKLDETILTGGKKESLIVIIPFQSDDKELYFKKNPIIDIDVNDFTLNDLLERFLDYFEEDFPEIYFDDIDIGFRYYIEENIGKVNLCDLNQTVLDEWVEYQALNLCRIFDGFMDDFIYIENSLNHSLNIFKRLKTYAMQIEKINLNYEIYTVSINPSRLKYISDNKMRFKGLELNHDKGQEN